MGYPGHTIGRESLRGRGDRPFLTWFAAWLAAALLLTLLGNLWQLRRPFDEWPGSTLWNEYAAWGGANWATMARSFVEHGVLALHGVPIQNNPPLGREPDAYLHWPPLSTIALSVVFRVFGESEGAARALMILLMLATDLVLYKLVKYCCGREEAVAAAFVFFTFPAVFIYGDMVYCLWPAIFFMLAAVLAFVRATESPGLDRRWAAIGLLSLALGCLSSWEALLVAPGLLAISLWRRQGPRVSLAVAYMAVGIGVCASLIVFYILNAPWLFEDFWHVVLFRAHLVHASSTHLHIHTIGSDPFASAGTVPSVHAFVWVLVSRLGMIGPFGILGLAGVLLAGWTQRGSASGRRAVLFAGLLAPWLLWSTLMSNHLYYHDFEMLILVPVAAAALGIALVAAARLTFAGPPGSTLRALRWIILIVLPALLVAPLAQSTQDRRHYPASPSPLLAYSLDIRQNTPPGSIVMIPDANQVPVYYSQRHTIRYIANDSLVAKGVELLPGVFPGAPVYLALHPDSLGPYPDSVRRYPVVKRTPNLLLLSIEDK